MTDRFAHQLRLDQIRDGDRIDLVADEAEREAVAKRLGLASLERLEAHAVMSRNGEAVRAEGRVSAALEQSCVASGEPVPEHVDEPFVLQFVPDRVEAAPDEEIELGAEDCDTIFYDGAQIDLGGAIADTLALSVDPYPRSPNAELALKQAGVLSEEQAGPFAALAALKAKSSD
jgi:uncharacterized metal-binding protein YceD (DUF177 family)